MSQVVIYYSIWQNNILDYSHFVNELNKAVNKNEVMLSQKVQPLMRCDKTHNSSIIVVVKMNETIENVKKI